MIKINTKIIHFGNILIDCSPAHVFLTIDK